MSELVNFLSQLNPFPVNIHGIDPFDGDHYKFSLQNEISNKSLSKYIFNIFGSQRKTVRSENNGIHF